ncbi:MAG: DNA-binding protein [Gammaproteobacteria bacterium]|nr:DNA-binding protein [Gammaproteobacteria bacterium]
MSLNNLIGRSLEFVEPDRATIARLLAAAERNIADSHAENVSSETRFDAAYKAIMQLANAALQANGYRTLTSKPGHHATMIQVLNLTIGLDRNTIIVLDALRKQRNDSDYLGDIIPVSTMADCISHAENLNRDVLNWIKENKPEFLEKQIRKKADN